MRPARRRLPRTGALLAAGALTATGLTGCQLLEVQEPERTPSAIELCVAAHDWVVDPDSIAANVQQRLSEHGAGGEVTVEGDQRLRWDLDGIVVLETDLRIAVTNEGPPLTTYEQTVRGTSGGNAVFTGDVGIPRNWSESELLVTESMTEDDAPVESLPWSLRSTWIDDTVGLVMQCSPDTLGVEGRGTRLTWTFHPEGWSPPAPADEATEESAEDA